MLYVAYRRSRMGSSSLSSCVQHEQNAIEQYQRGSMNCCEVFTRFFGECLDQRRENLVENDARQVLRNLLFVTSALLQRGFEECCSCTVAKYETVAVE